MTKRHPTIPHLIVNSPFAEPSTYWQYESVGWTFSQEPGRRPAGYIVATPGSNHREDPGKFIELEPHSAAREDVAREWLSGSDRHLAAVAGTLARPRAT